MSDLTALKTPFGLLDAETQEALRAHGGPYEVWTVAAWVGFNREPAFFDGSRSYRVKPAPPKPREWWVNVYDGSTNIPHGEGYVHKDKQQAERLRSPHGETIRVREVLE